MSNYALVNNTTNEVENLEVYNSTPTNPTGYTYYSYTDNDLVCVGGTRNADGTYTVVEYVETEDDLKQLRLDLLKESDFVVTRHRDQVAASATTTITDAKYQEWLTYRQDLRDLPATSGWPSNVTWPTKP